MRSLPQRKEALHLCALKKLELFGRLLAVEAAKKGKQDGFKCCIAIVASHPAA